MKSKERKHQERAIVVEEWSSLQNAFHAVLGYYAKDSSERLALFRNDGGERVSQEFIACSPPRKLGTYVKRTNISFVRLNTFAGD